MITRPRKQGLYDPQFEHDACGVGFVVNVNGQRSYDIIRKGLQILENLDHRGACGCDPLTGDGAGILMQVPHAFFAKECARLDIPLPAAGEYGVGLVFLPQDIAERNLCAKLLEKVIREEGQRLLGWRQVPIDDTQCGWLARKGMPYIRQILIGQGRGVTDQESLERKLYIIRKRIERLIRESGLRDSETFYI